MQEKRSHARASISLPVTCELSDGRTFQGEGRDIGVGGMFVSASTQLPFDARITVIAQLPGGARPSRIPAIVRWSKADGFGVQFGLLGALETHLITKLMRP
ncbi:MAG: PilZ domain-containing protein [Polyangiaceae bacterium]|nr:PilZ domain-containing protein [Polyangiaceae bacterium]